MSLLAHILIRILGPLGVLTIFGSLLAPAMSQPSRVYVNTDVALLVGERLGSTLSLIALAILLATTIWLPLAMLTSWRRSLAPLTAAPVSVIAQALAPFWIGIVGILLFSTQARLLPAVGAGSAAQLVLPATALAIVLLGFLAHTTYLRAVSRDVIEAESTGSGPAAHDTRLEIVEDWLDTLGRQAGMLIGAVILIETVFSWPGLGRFFINGLRNADAPTRSIALFDLIALSAALTVLFGVGAELVRWCLDRQHAAAPARLSVDDETGSSARPSSAGEPRWLAVLTVALGGLILVVLLILATTGDDRPMAAQASAALQQPGAAGYAFGTDGRGRDLHARIADGIYTVLQIIVPGTLLAAVLGVPLGLAAASRRRVVSGALSVLLDGLLTVSSIILVYSGLDAEGGISYEDMIILVMVPVLARLIRDAVRAVWSGERRDGQTTLGAIVMALCIGMGSAALLEAALSFIGVRAPALTTSLGEMVASGSPFLTRAPWLAVYPGVALTALASSLIMIGYGALGLLRSRPPAVAEQAEKARRLVVAR